jgi:hypothetical protein
MTEGAAAAADEEETVAEEAAAPPLLLLRARVLPATEDAAAAPLPLLLPARVLRDVSTSIASWASSSECARVVGGGLCGSLADAFFFSFFFFAGHLVHNSPELPLSAANAA